MNINRNNYEQYVLDYLENRLDREGMLLMNRFLSENPDIEEEVGAYDISLEVKPDSDSFKKSSLLRSFDDINSVNPENFEEFCVAHYEGDLNKKSTKLLREFLHQQPELKSIYELHSKLRFLPDQKILFPYKKTLKQHIVIPFKNKLFLGAVGAAAMIAFFILFQPNPTKHTTIKLPGIASSQIQNKAIVKSVEERHVTENPSMIKNITERNIFRQKNQIAVLDSSNSRQYEKVVIASIQPIFPSIKNDAPILVNDSGTIAKNSEESLVNAEQKKEEDVVKGNYNSPIKDIRSKLLWSALRFSIKGINSLTENNLALHAEQNSAGKLSAFALENDNFEISKKISKNIQN